MIGGEQRPTGLAEAPDSFVLASELNSTPLGKALGEGSAAEVFAIKLPSVQAPAVVKISRGLEYEESLLREARVLTLGGGSFAPRLFGIGRRSDGRLALALERASGVSLRSALETTPVEQTARESLARLVLTHGARALRHLHAWGLSHGDFKPDNVYLDPDHGGRLTLIDLGLSSGAEKVEGGTPRYLPRSVLQGSAVSPLAADTFALAMTVAEILLPELWERNAPPEELAGALTGSMKEWLGPVLRPSGAPLSLDYLADRIARSDQSPDSSSSHHVLQEIRRQYIATRLSELESVALERWEFPRGLPGHWLRQVAVRMDALRAMSKVSTTTLSFSATFSAKPNLSRHDRGRFLGRLIGPTATSWQFSDLEDDHLVDRLHRLGMLKPIRSLVYGDVRDDSVAQAESARSASEPAELALEVARRPVAREVLVALASKEVPSAVRLEGARAARQMGDLFLAEELLSQEGSSSALLERSTIASRRGDREVALDLRNRASERANEPRDRARARAAQARALLDSGDLSGAAMKLSGQPAVAGVQEVRALLELARGEGQSALLSAREGTMVAATDEELARLFGVQGMCLHHLARPEESMEHFARACELAGRASAALEEATFATGWAAAATDAGHLEVALQASERAEVLFESLLLGPQTGRALLARVAALSALGMTRELLPLAERGLSVCRRVEDRLCEAYLCFCLCDVLPDQEARLAYARRAAKLVRDGSLDDRLRASARLVSCGEKPEDGAVDWAERSKSREALADWYGARARALERLSSHATTEGTKEAGRAIVMGLIELSSSDAKFFSLGSSLVAGAHLALRLGLADEARRLFEHARSIAEGFLQHLSGRNRTLAEELPWVQQARGSRTERETGSSQLSDVESLLRALSQRKGFRALLNQTLDLLLLWTGVERGLLLLRAPGEKLVVRAARNLNRDDLTEEQSALSFSMARRALKEGRPVVAVDAVNDVSEIHRSVHALNLRSVLAVPLTARGEVLGVAYLDDRVRRGAFGERELSWVGLIATIAALAIFDERDRLELKRAARRASSAKKRLSEQLTDREAELELAERELSRISGDRKLRGDYSHIIGRSVAMRELLQLVDRVSQSDIPALVVGESGTGKELIARAIASAGPRRDGAFVAENCAAVPEALLESTLFGHKKGAFTGATRDQLGLFELAHKGTLFLDEIGDMPLSMQAKLLRVLQDGEVRQLGGGRAKPVDVRVIAATHKDLKEMVEHGAFREDLYYRLNVVTLGLPPLRERREDIVVLVEHFLKKHAVDRPRTISAPALRRLMQFSWPGNVRQLENEVRRMVVLGGETLTAADLSPEVLGGSSQAPEARTLREKVDLLERRLLLEALEEAQGNRTRAAEALGLSRFGLQKMIQRLEISVPKNPSKAGRIQARGLDESQ